MFLKHAGLWLPMLVLWVYSSGCHTATLAATCVGRGKGVGLPVLGTDVNGSLSQVYGELSLNPVALHQLELPQSFPKPFSLPHL